MRVVPFGVLGLLLACGGAAPENSPSPSERVQVFSGAMVWDGLTDAVRPDLVLIVRDGRIERLASADDPDLPAGAERIELEGKFLLPGLVNGHGHVGFADGLKSGPEVYNAENVLRQLDLYAHYGVTTVLSLGSAGSDLFGMREERISPGLNRSRFYSSGPLLQPASVEEAQSLVEEAMSRQVDYIKIRVDDQLGTVDKMPAEVSKAVIDEAHKRGAKVAAHVFYLEDAKDLLRAGVDFLAHSIRDREIDAEMIQLLRDTDVCVCPTLVREVSTFVYESRPDFFQDPFFLERADPSILDQLSDPERMKSVGDSRAAQSYKQALVVAKKNLKLLSDANISIAFGTDSGPPGRFQGYFEHLELQLMAEAGLSPSQILRAGTSQAAACLGWQEEVGSLQAGRWADFVVFRENPLQDISHSKSIDSVWIAGNRVR